jgi:hypothetical protein
LNDLIMASPIPKPSLPDLLRATALAISGALVLAVVLALAATGDAIAGTGVAARAARSLNVTDTARLHYLPRESEGSTLVEEGSATGRLPGHMRAHLVVGATFSGTFTFYASGGSIKGHGSANPQGSGRYESFHGALIVTGGTGRFVHARGKAGLYGVFDRTSYALTVQTTGTLSY